MGIAMTMLKLKEFPGFEKYWGLVHELQASDEEMLEYAERVPDDPEGPNLIANKRSSATRFRVTRLVGVCMLFALVNASAVLIMSHVCPKNLWSYSGCLDG